MNIVLLQRKRRRERWPYFFKVFRRRIREIECVRVYRPLHEYFDRTMAIPTRLVPGILEAFTNTGNVAKQYLFAVRERPDLDAAKIRCRLQET